MTNTSEIYKTDNEDDQTLEKLHRTLFDHPDTKTWNETRSLAQPSFLKQIESYTSPHCGSVGSPVRVSKK